MRSQTCPRTPDHARDRHHWSRQLRCRLARAGRILAALATGDPVDHDLSPFRLARFEGWNGRAEALTLHG
ncbi:hypothetical protein [Salipiger thiooxidans]|uniref:hypothetical protein n=1 Tax=Salipiger thiooxidans TaxID=282683 RepID=UPI001CD75476|nr:hypothetical protein [Salipiger thiooxidans]MCA0848566.1 hypothetical protein [Salipiger thiooxidans]